MGQFQTVAELPPESQFLDDAVEELVDVHGELTQLHHVALDLEVLGHLASHHELDGQSVGLLAKVRGRKREHHGLAAVESLLLAHRTAVLPCKYAKCYGKRFLRDHGSSLLVICTLGHHVDPVVVEEVEADHELAVDHCVERTRGRHAQLR